MTSVNTIRLPGLATGMDTDTMIKNMLSGEQAKIDRVKQKEQTIKWQQELYRDIIKDIKGFKDNYLSVTSPNSIVSNSAWNTLSITSSNENVISATGSAGANNINYNFEVNKMAEPAKAISALPETVTVIGADGKPELDTDGNPKVVEVDGNTKLSDLGLGSETTIKLNLGKDSEGKTIYSKDIEVKKGDTLDDLMKKINDSTNGKIKANFSDMTGQVTIETSDTGTNASFAIEPSDGLKFLGLYEDKNGTSTPSSSFSGSNSEIIVKDKNGIEINTISNENNSFTIDGINYTVNGEGTADLKSKQDVQPVVDNMKKFVEDYNKIMDEMYGLITEKKKPDYLPLTEEQKKDMEKEEIEAWEKKAKVGLLRNDSEMRSFMDHMQTAIFGENADFLREAGLTTNEDYTKRGQLSLNEDKFKKALETNGDKVYEAFNGKNGMLEKMNNTMYDYVGSSSSVFAKKAGLEKTASATNNFYSEQLKRQADIIKSIQRKMDDKEDRLYKQFGQLEASMNKLNSQMNYFMQM